MFKSNNQISRKVEKCCFFYKRKFVKLPTIYYKIIKHGQFCLKIAQQLQAYKSFFRIREP